MKASWFCGAYMVTALFAAALPARADTTLVIGMAADPTGFDPEAVLNNTSGFVMATIYDSLIRYKSGTTEVAPGLAETWNVSADGLTYTFHLRKGVTFQDGTPFNAKTYIQGIDRLLNKQSPDFIYNTGPVENFVDFTYEDVVSYRAVDDDTVEFKLKQPSAALLASLAMVWNGVVSPTAVTKYGKDFRNHPVGSGPFIFKEWRPRDQISLDANPNYWGGKPKVDHLVFKEYPDPQAALLALKRGDVQILGDLSSQIIPALRADANIELLTQPGLAISGVGMPFDVAPFDDKRVRQALNYAIDREAIDKALFQGLAAPMTSPLPESQWGFDKSLKGYGYDPEKAKKLLADAGVKLPLKVEFLTYNSPRGYNSAGPDLATAIQAYLGKVGIEADLRKVDMGANLATIRSGKYQGLFMVGFSGDNGDPDNFVGELFNSKRIPVGNTARYRNPETDKLLDQAAAEANPDKRLALYSQVQKQILDDAPWIFINSVLQVRAIRKDVKGYMLNPTQMYFGMENVSLEK
ncbi:peptide/nickel transport system substrate-binding protein [Rhizobiales bacterium GAS191]|nr:peptide/nickel transport system substrate-binding protein [Rhizobiales bacterium GAS191]